MHNVLNQKGVSKIALMFWLLVLFSVIHIGLKLVPMYMDSYRMKDKMELMASISQSWKDEEIVPELIKKARELELPLKAESFILIRDEDKHTMKISTAWDVEQHFFFDVYPLYTTRTYHFALVAEADSAKGIK